MTTTSRRTSPADIAAAVPDLALSALFLMAWVAPGALLRGTITYLMLLMLLEFIIVHSSAFMGSVMLRDLPRPQKATALLGIGGFYTLFVGAFALAFRTWWPLWSFWGLMVNRLLNVLIGQAPDEERRILLQKNWAVSALSYLLLCFVTVLLPLPRLGLTPDVVSRESLPGSGLWVDQPHRVMAFGFLYFLAVGISGAFAHGWLPASGLTPIPKAGRPQSTA
jgi:hypothetical protein